MLSSHRRCLFPRNHSELCLSAATHFNISRLYTAEESVSQKERSRFAKLHLIVLYCSEKEVGGNLIKINNQLKEQCESTMSIVGKINGEILR